MNTGDIHPRPEFLPTGGPEELPTMPDPSKDKESAGKEIKQGFISIAKGVQHGVSSVGSPALAAIQKRSGNVMESLKNSGVGLFARNMAANVVIHAKFLAGSVKNLAGDVTDACKNKLGFKDQSAKLLQNFDDNKSAHEKLEKGINKLVQFPVDQRAFYTKRLTDAKTGAASAKEIFEQSRAAHSKARSDVREAKRDLLILREERNHLQRQFDQLKSDDPNKEKYGEALEVADGKVRVAGDNLLAAADRVNIKEQEEKDTKTTFESAVTGYYRAIKETHDIPEHQHIDIRSKGERIEEFAKKAEAKAEAGGKEAIRLGGEAAGAARGVAKAAYKEVKESSLGKMAGDLIDEQKEKSQLLAYSQKCDQQIRIQSDLAAQYGQTVNPVMERIDQTFGNIDVKAKAVTDAYAAFKADPSEISFTALENAIDSEYEIKGMFSTLSKFSLRELDDFFVAVKNKKTAAETSTKWENRKNTANELFGDLQSKRQVLRQQEVASRANAPVEGEIDRSLDDAQSNLNRARNLFESFVREPIVPESLPGR